MDGSTVYFTDQNLVNQAGVEDPQFRDNDFITAGNKFIHFIRECQVRNTYVYREQLKNNAQRGKYFLRVDMEHLIAFDDPLVEQLRSMPNEYIKVFEDSLQTIYQNDLYDETDVDSEPSPKFQI
jgi:DNA replication licensing factor MCM5